MKKVLFIIPLLFTITIGKAQEAMNGTPLVAAVPDSTVFKIQKANKLTHQGLVCSQLGLACLSGSALFIGAGFLTAPTTSNNNGQPGLSTTSTYTIIGGIAGAVGIIFEAISIHLQQSAYDVFKDNSTKKVSFYQGKDGTGIAFNF